jgi:hypothetical protein
MSTRKRACIEPAKPAKVDWLSVAEELCKTHQVEHEEREASRRLRTREEISLAPNQKKRFCAGDSRLRDLMRILDSFKMEVSNALIVRSVQQKKFHHWFIQAVLPHIFGEDWDTNCQRVLGEFDLDKLYPEVLCITPRRYGKTWAVSMFVAALLMCVPGIRVAVFSTGKRASSWLMRKVVKFIKDIEGGADRIVRQNQEELFVGDAPLNKGMGLKSVEAKNRTTSPGTSEFYSFPNAVDGESRFACVCVLWGGRPRVLRFLWQGCDRFRAKRIRII